MDVGFTAELGPHPRSAGSRYRQPSSYRGKHTSSQRGSVIYLFFPDPGPGIGFTVDMTNNVIKKQRYENRILLSNLYFML